ncbi:MAG: transcriptional repressor [Nitrospirae bacterium]|nr:transcriptional repressor [Nitrospirota bacterium]
MEKYRCLGIKLTPQRLAILDYLRDNTSHPSAEDIYKIVLKNFPTMSFATVYNSLEAMKKSNCINELNIDPAKKRYDPNMSPHHHIICKNCNVIYDIHKNFDLSLPASMKRGFELLGNHIEFYGLCEKCQA